MTEAEYKDQHPEYDENEKEHDCSLCRKLVKDKEKDIQWCGCEGGIDNCLFVPKPLSLEEALNVTDTFMNLDYNGLSQDEIDVLDSAVELVFRAARKYLKGVKGE